MSDTNYIGSIVKVLENPTEIFLSDNISFTQFRVQVPQIRNTRIINLVFWGNLARDVANYYQVNDYIIIEGYISLRNNNNSDLIAKNLKRIQITVLKVYPFLLSYDRHIKN